MAERSFAREVQDLKLGAGEEFRGEGILAVTKALLQSGVGYVAGYQGAPISHLMDVLTDAEGRLRDAASKKIFVEVVLLRAIQARNAVSIDTVLGQLRQLRAETGPNGAARSIPAIAISEPLLQAEAVPA